MSLLQVILERYARTAPLRERYLPAIVEECESAEIRDHIDPYGMDLGPLWQRQLALGKQYLQGEGQAEKIAKIQQELKKHGLSFVPEHIALLMEKKQEQSSFKLGNQVATGNKEIHLVRFCERSRNREFFPFNSPVFKLSGNLLRMGDIQKSLDLQQLLKHNLSLDVPAIHILIDLYKIEAYFLHAAMLAQIDWEEEDGNIDVSNWWGGMSIQNFSVAPAAIDSLKENRSFCEQFLEGCFQLAWLEFDPKEELALVEHFETKVPPETIQEVRKIQSELEKQGFPLSFLKVLAFSGAVTSTQLLEAVLKNVYQVPVKVVDQSPKKKSELGQTMAVSSQHLAQKGVPAKKTAKPAVDKKPAPGPKALEKTMAISSQHLAQKAPQPKSKPQKPAADSDKAVKKALSQTMAVSQQHLVKKAKESPKAASKIMGRLLQREQDRAAQPAMEIPKAQEAPAVEEAAPPAVAKAPIATVTIDADTARIREAIARKMVSPEKIFDAALIQSAKGNKKLLEILQEENFLSKDQYAELKILPAREQQIQVQKPSQAVDLMLAHLLVDYQILSRDQVQKALRIQNSMDSLGIFHSLGDLLVKSRTLAGEMVDPLLSECARRQKQTAVATAEAPKPPAKTALPAYAPLVAVSLIFVIAIVSATVFFWPEGPVQPVAVSGPAVTPKGEEVPGTAAEKDRTTPASGQQETTRRPKKSVPKSTARAVELPQILSVTFDLQDVDAQYSSEPKRLFIQGNFGHNLDKETAKGLRLAIEIWDIWKEEQCLFSEISLPTKEFQLSNSLDKPLAEGMYYLRFSVISPSQRERWECWQPFSVAFSMHEAEMFRRWYRENFQTLEKILVEILEQQKSLQEFGKKPLNEIRKNWPSWSEKWKDRNKQLLSRLAERKEDTLLPFCVSLDLQMIRLLVSLQSAYDGVREWQAGFSLFPPHKLLQDSGFQTSAKDLSRVLDQRRAILDALTPVERESK